MYLSFHISLHIVHTKKRYPNTTDKYEYRSEIHENLNEYHRYEKGFKNQHQELIYVQLLQP